MTIRDTDKFMRRLWDWGILKGCFGDTRIEPTDVDGMVERNGQFLVLEAKGENVSLTRGQAIMFEQLRRQGNFTILVLWGVPNTPQHMHLMTATDLGQRVPCDLAAVRETVSEWFRVVNAGPAIKAASA